MGSIKLVVFFWNSNATKWLSNNDFNVAALFINVHLGISFLANCCKWNDHLYVCTTYKETEGIEEKH